MAKELEGLRALQRHDERVASTAKVVRNIIARQDPNRISYYDPGPVQRVVGIPLGLDLFCEFDESYPVAYLDGRVLGFRPETLSATIPRMEAIFREAYSHQEHSIRSPMGYMVFYIWSDNQRQAGTRTVGIDPRNIQDSLDTLFEYFDEVIEDKIKPCEYNYEFIYASNAVSHVHFKFVVRYYPEPQSVKNWGEVKPVERCNLFDIFTASDDTNCVRQCAQRIWGLDAKEECIGDFINRAQHKVCILKPRSYVKHVTNILTYNDLVVDPIGPIKHLRVIDPDVIYLLHWKEHLGVLENMKQQKRNQFMTTFRPLTKYPRCKKLTVCFDIECYFDPHSKTEGTRHTPYLCCACFIYDNEAGNVMEFEGRDCVAQMMDWTAELAKEFDHQHVELIAHNGGGYDFHYILGSMYDPASAKDIMIRNNSFISFRFKHMSIEFSVKDSLNFLLCSLSSAAKAFLSSYSADGRVEYQMGKTDFPHHEVRSKEDLQRTFQKWMSVDNIVNVDVEKEKMLITGKHVVLYDEDSESKKLIDWAKEYCCNDVIVLAKVWIKFKQTVADIFNCQIVDQTHTLAGLSFRLFEAHLANDVYLHHPTKEDFMNMRESLIGGRCISVNGMYGDVACLDVKSLYPAAMAFYDQPYGKYRRTRNRPHNELGIYYVKVTPKPTVKHGFFPLRKMGEVGYLINEEESESYKAWYTTVDVDIGIKEGHKIEYIPFDNKGSIGYSWKQKGKIFKDYIQDVLYKLKLKYEEAGDAEKRQVIKIIMNSLWGKFAQKWMDTKYKIVNEDDADLDEECYKIWGTDHMLVKKIFNTKYSRKPLQNGIFTLSWARWHMKLVWGAIAKSEAVMLYSDTDSVMVKSGMIKGDAKFVLDEKMINVIGTDVGQLEQEYKFDEVICVGKKQYIGKYYKNGIPQYKFRFKGVPQQYIKPEMYTHLLNSPSHEVRIDFLKFKREWGAVHGYIESKTVTAT
ncbi:DNA polymerase [Coemansia reversa NRRL 1564]|uniref:DNA polymerase n=1 Tax=Coemansia reversa (strain ATCC 12441 / NRRL 1564) TaxID=763665 RepID=A0A2G5B1M2_COERN|nr:DNA polymerase [Coemansia reversa NRRL 1564]|eukprot:PIA12617.1 DNA polymerase [Coemansia reversa NRRL 1564]